MKHFKMCLLSGQVLCIDYIIYVFTQCPLCTLHFARHYSIQKRMETKNLIFKITEGSQLTYVEQLKHRYVIGRVCNDDEGCESTGKFKASENSRKDVRPGAGRILKTPDLNRHTFLEEWQWEGGTSYFISGLEEPGSSFLLFLWTIVYKRNIDGRPLCKNCSSDIDSFFTSFPSSLETSLTTDTSEFTGLFF